MPAVMHDYLSQESHWMLPVFFTVLMTVIIGALARAVLRRIKTSLQRTRTPWDEAALEVAEAPLIALVWVLGLNVASNIIAEKTGAWLFQHADYVRGLLVIALIAWFLLRFVNAVEAALVTPPGGGPPMVDITTSRAVAKVLRISIIITATLILLQKLGYSVSGVLAFGGIGGIAVGFAAKDLLANFFGGLMIFLDRPFSIGDYVRSPDRELEGTVEYIGWRLTRIRTAEKRPLYVPNSTFASIAVENLSRMTHRRISQSLALRYADWPQLPAIVEDLRQMLMAHQGIAQDQALMVSVERLAESSVSLLVLAFTRSNDWVEFNHVRQDVLLRTLEIFSRHGAELAVPEHLLHFDRRPGTRPSDRH